MEQLIVWLLAFVLGPFVLGPAVGYTIAKAQNLKAQRESEKKILESLIADPTKLVEMLITTYQQKGLTIQTTIDHHGDVLVRAQGKPWVNVSQYLRDQR